MPAVWIFIEGHLGEFSPRRLYGQSVAQSGQIMDAGRPFKFGLEAGSKPELFAALAVHRDPEEMAESLVLVHFHVGSQVPDIGVIKRAVREAARFYANGGLGGRLRWFADCIREFDELHAAGVRQRRCL